MFISVYPKELEKQTGAYEDSLVHVFFRCIPMSEAEAGVRDRHRSRTQSANILDLQTSQDSVNESLLKSRLNYKNWGSPKTRKGQGDGYLVVVKIFKKKNEGGKVRSSTRRYTD